MTPNSPHGGGAHDPRWVLAVDHGTSSTVGAVADVDPADGWVRVGAVGVDGATSIPSAVLSRPEGTVLAGRPALEAGAADPSAVVLRARSHLAAGDPDELLTTWPRPTTAVNVATALVAKVLHSEAARRGTLPTALVLTHPSGWSEASVRALRTAGEAMLSALPHSSPAMVETLASPPAAAYRLGAAGPVVVADLGGGGTELALVGPPGDGFPTLLAPPRTLPVGAEVLDDALAHLVLDRAHPELATRIRFGGDLDAHRAWYSLRTGIRAAKETLGAQGRVTVGLPVLPPESPTPQTVTLTHGDLAGLLGPGLEEVGRGIYELLADAGPRDGGRPALLVRGGITDLPEVRPWLAARAGLALAHGADPGAVSAFGPVSGAAAWVARRIGLGPGNG